MADFSWYAKDKRISDADFKQSLRVFLEITHPLISRGEVQKNTKEQKNKVQSTFDEDNVRSMTEFNFLTRKQSKKKKRGKVMSKLDGIKDFIEANKSSLENGVEVQFCHSKG